MKRKAKIIIILWFLITAIFIAFQESVFYFGKEVVLETRPVDPRDFLRGDYVDLEFNITKYTAPDNITKRYRFDKPVYVVLNTNGNVAQIDYITQDKMPKNKLFIKGKLTNSYNNEYKFKYGIESYFVKQNTGRQLENELSEGGYAKVKIDKFGAAKIISIKKDLPI